VGKHRDVSCKACHKTKDHKKTPNTCRACHKKDDEHRGNFGATCKGCHTPKDWGVSLFNHGRSAKYKLRGAHKKITCVSCHKGLPAKEKNKTSCYACHQSEDVHKGQEGKQCQQCHVESSWTRTRFDHDLYTFPLLGKHKKVKCKECHDDSRFKDAPSGCNACHAKDDEHKKRLGTKCETCHNARGWRYWVFNHNRNTHFPLTGGHKKIRCVACHTRPAGKRIGTSTRCVSCHEDDDVHRGEFGSFCERCHVPSSFRHLKQRPGTAR